MVAMTMLRCYISLISTTWAIFGHKLKYWLTKDITIHGNPSNSYRDISLKMRNANLMLVLGEKSGDEQDHLDPLSGSHECAK